MQASRLVKVRQPINPERQLVVVCLSYTVEPVSIGRSAMWFWSFVRRCGKLVESVLC